MSDRHSIGERWATVTSHYRDTHPAHEQGPTLALVEAVAEAGIECGVWPSTSHFTLCLSAEDPHPQGFFVRTPDPPRLSAEYWREVDKFRLRYWNIRGVPYDEKWCDLPEAQAIFRHLFHHLRPNSGAA